MLMRSATSLAWANRKANALRMASAKARRGRSGMVFTRQLSRRAGPESIALVGVTRLQAVWHGRLARVSVAGFARAGRPCHYFAAQVSFQIHSPVESGRAESA